MNAAVAVIQMSPGADQSVNLSKADALLAKAAGNGAEICVLPEMFSALVGTSRWSEISEPAGGKVERFLSERAAEHRLLIVGGSYIEAAGDYFHNTCAVFAPDGSLVGRYRKMHLFWTHIEGQASYDERTCLVAGDKRLVFEALGFRVSVGICYDLRFPEFFRDPRQEPVDLYCMGAAFMQATGIAHWHTLVRARAIENLAYVAAAGTVGEHYPIEGRAGEVLKTFGHSMIVSPWGEVLDQVASGEGVAMAEASRSTLEQSRARLCALDHMRDELWGVW